MSGTLYFVAGKTQKTILVAILDDAFAEEKETFTLSLAGAVAANIADNQAIGAVIDDDALSTAFSEMA